MQEFRVRVQGISPLLMHRFGEEEAMAATNGTRAAIRSEERTPEEIAAGFVYKDEEEVIGIPAPNLYASLIEAGRWIKSGKSKLSTQKSSMIPGFMWLEDVFLRIEPAKWHVDTRPVRIPSTGGRILRHRPIFYEWGFGVTFTADLTVASEAVIRQLFDISGSRVGLGDFRPACKGPYGRFRVDAWDRN